MEDREQLEANWEFKVCYAHNSSVILPVREAEQLEAEMFKLRYARNRGVVHGSVSGSSWKLLNPKSRWAHSSGMVPSRGAAQLATSIIKLQRHLYVSELLHVPCAHAKLRVL